MERHKYLRKPILKAVSLLSEAVEIVKELLSEEQILNRWTRYLAAYRVVEGNLALFDKLARCRDFSEFETAVYEALRVKDRVRRRLQEKVERKEVDLGSLAPDQFTVDDSDLKVLMGFATRSSKAPKAVGALIASFGLAYGGIREIGR